MSKFVCPECRKLVEIEDTEMVVEMLTVYSGKPGALTEQDSISLIVKVFCPKCRNRIWEDNLDPDDPVVMTRFLFDWGPTGEQIDQLRELLEDTGIEVIE